MQKNFFIKLVVLIGMVISISACSDYLGADSETLWKKAFVANQNSFSSMLTDNTWVDGNITSSNPVNWFKFTATVSSIQPIHFIFGMLTDLYVQVYDSDGNKIGSETGLHNAGGGSGTGSYYRKYTTSFPVINGQMYYIRVRPYSSGSSGTYQIAFLNVTTLTADTWADDDLPQAGEHWFKFTATASEQYIHFSPGTLAGINVQVYNSGGNTVSSQVSLHYYSRNKYSVTRGQEYYIKVEPYSSSSSNSSPMGTYKIAFNTVQMPPGITVTTLTANTWTNGNLLQTTREQWFKFTATTSTQYIHFNPGTLTGLYVQMYDSTVNKVGSEIELYYYYYYDIGGYRDKKYTSLSVTSGQEYYIRVTPYNSNSGTYSIAFNESSSPPS